MRVPLRWFLWLAEMSSPHICQSLWGPFHWAFCLILVAIHIIDGENLLESQHGGSKPEGDNKWRISQLVVKKSWEQGNSNGSAMLLWSGNTMRLVRTLSDVCVCRKPNMAAINWLPLTGIKREIIFIKARIRESIVIPTASNIFTESINIVRLAKILLDIWLYQKSKMGSITGRSRIV